MGLYFWGWGHIYRGFRMFIRLHIWGVHIQRGLCTGDKLTGFYSISVEEELTKKMNVKVNFCGEAKF